MLFLSFKTRIFSRLKSYDIEYAKKYLERRREVEDQDKRHFGDLFAKYNISISDGVVLDLASGPGFDLKILSEFNPSSLIWHDKMEGPYIMALEVLADVNGVEFNRADLMNLEKYEDDSIDFTLCRESLYYVGNDYLFFREIKRILKSGGVFWVKNVSFEFYKNQIREGKISLFRQVINKLNWFLYIFTGIRFLAFTPVDKKRLSLIFRKLGFNLLFMKEESGIIEFAIYK